MSAQTVQKPNVLPRNDEHRIVIRGVYFCTRGR